MERTLLVYGPDDRSHIVHLLSPESRAIKLLYGFWRIPKKQQRVGLVLRYTLIEFAQLCGTHIVGSKGPGQSHAHVVQPLFRIQQAQVGIEPLVRFRIHGSAEYTSDLFNLGFAHVLVFEFCLTSWQAASQHALSYHVQ